MKITTYTNSVDMTAWDRYEHEQDVIGLGLSMDGDYVIFGFNRNDGEIPFYMTFEEAIRVANELKLFAEGYK